MDVAVPTNSNLTNSTAQVAEHAEYLLKKTLLFSLRSLRTLIEDVRPSSFTERISGNLGELDRETFELFPRGGTDWWHGLLGAR